MAYENGSNIFNYSPEIFLRYRKDKMIFAKALQIIQIFQTRVDYPFCFDEMDQAISLILGAPFQSFFFCGYVYINAVNEDDYDPTQVFDPESEKNVNLVEGLSEDEIKNIDEEYRDAIKSFTISIQHLSADVFPPENGGLGLKSVAYNRTNDQYKKIRVIRNDNESLDLSLSKDELEFLIRQLSEIYSDGEQSDEK